MTEPRGGPSICVRELDRFLRPEHKHTITSQSHHNHITQQVPLRFEFLSRQTEENLKAATISKGRKRRKKNTMAVRQRQLTSPFFGLRLLLPLSEREERVGGAERRTPLPETGTRPRSQ